MTIDPPRFSKEFERLYCDPRVFASFSTIHPISFARVLPFQSHDRVLDDARLTRAESAHLANQNDQTRRDVIDAYAQCGLLSAAEAGNVKTAIDYFGADFFGLMGLVYANADMFICALRWQREFIQALETQNASTGSPHLDSDGVYSSVGYCLYSLGLFEETISWTKSCIGPGLLADVACRTLITTEAGRMGATLLAVERSGQRTRYTLSAPTDAEQATETTAQLKTALKEIAPSEEIYVNWQSKDAPSPTIQPGGYPFRVELDSSDLPRHRMNLIFAICGQADVWIESGHVAEAKRLLSEAVMLEPDAGFVCDRIQALACG